VNARGGKKKDGMGELSAGATDPRKKPKKQKKKKKKKNNTTKPPPFQTRIGASERKRTKIASETAMGGWGGGVGWFLVFVVGCGWVGGWR